MGEGRRFDTLLASVTNSKLKWLKSGDCDSPACAVECWLCAEFELKNNYRLKSHAQVKINKNGHFQCMRSQEFVSN